MKYIKRKIYWEEPTDQNQYLTVSYREKSAADIEENYTTVNSSVLVDTEGFLPNQLEIEFPEQGTEYIVRYMVNGYGTYFDEEVKTPIEFETIGPVDKVHNVIPSMEYSFPVSGLRNSHLPGIGTLYELSESVYPSIGSTVPLQLTGTPTFEERDGLRGIVLNDLTGLSFPSSINELSVIGINDEQSMKDYTFGVWFYLRTSDFAQSPADNKIWLIYSGDQTKHFGIFLDSVTKFINWEYKNVEVTERVILDTQILPETWTKVFVRRKVNSTNSGILNQIMVSFDGVDYVSSEEHTFSLAVNYTGSSLNPVYVGQGKNDSGTIMSSNGIFRNLYYLEGNITDELRLQIQNPIYPSIIFDGPVDLGLTDVAISESDVRFTIPTDIPSGEYDILVRSALGDTDPVSVNYIPLERSEEDFEIDFGESVEDARSALVDKFWTLEGEFSNFRTEMKFVYVEKDCLALEVHNVNVDNTNVGAAIVSKDYLGFGTYKVKAKMPVISGAALLMWVSNADTEYSFIEAPTGLNSDSNYIFNGIASNEDSEYASHEYELRWYADRVEYYLDGILVETKTTSIPQNIGRFGIGFWQPGTSQPGYFDKVLVEKISFESGGGSNSAIGEPFPFENMVAIGV